MVDRIRQSVKKRRNGSDGDGRSTRQLLAESTPPQNLDAERAVLGSILRDNICMPDVARILKVEDFYSDSHQKMYAAMLGMSDHGKPIDVLTLGEELSGLGSLQDVGGAPTLIELYDQTLTAANVLHYAKIVQDKSVLRSLIHAGTEILRDTYDGTNSPDELLAGAEKKIFSILEHKTTGEAREIKGILHDVFTRISDRQSGKAGTRGIPSRFDDLDEMTNGWQDNELVIMAARPAVGKTAMALNFVDFIVNDVDWGPEDDPRRGMPVLFSSLEMGEIEIAERMLCLRAQVNGQQLRKGRVSQEDMDKLLRASEELSQAPLFIDDTPGQTMMHVAATARRLKLRHGLKMVIIDYLQLIEADDKSVSRQEQISTISRRLKTLARELHCPVMALSQLNRSVENREGHRPRTSDLRESGSLEQDADVVLLLHRDDAFDPDKNPGQAEIIISKQRNGPVGTVKLTFRKELTRFESFAQELTPFSASDDNGF